MECLCDWSPVSQTVSHTYQSDPRQLMCALGDALRLLEAWAPLDFTAVTRV